MLFHVKGHSESGFEPSFGDPVTPALRAIPAALGVRHGVVSTCIVCSHLNGEKNESCPFGKGIL